MELWLTLSNPFGSSTKPDLREPYVYLDLAFTWDKGYPEEQILPTLQMIKVPKHLRRNGKDLGTRLVQATFEAMLYHGIHTLEFSDYSGGFWTRMSEVDKFGAHVLLHSDGLGMLRLDTQTQPTLGA